MKTFIFTSFDCLIKFRDKQKFLEKNQNISFDDEYGLIYVYPTGKSDRYSFTLNPQNPSPSIFYRTIKRDDGVYFFLIDGLILENVDVYSFSYKGDDSFIEIDKSKISFITKKHKKTISLPSQIKSVKCGNFKHIDYVSFASVGKHFLIAYNIASNKAKLLQGEKIDILEDGFIVSEKNQNYKRIEEEYVVDEDGLKVKSRVFTQKEKSFGNQTVYDFMSAINIKDYESAISLLSPSLQDKISTSTLKNYFGDISYFFCIDKNSCFAISNDKNTLYNFSVNNNLIDEISDNN